MGTALGHLLQSLLEKAQSEGQERVFPCRTQKDTVLWALLGSTWALTSDQMPLEALPLGSCSELTPGGGCFSPWTPGEALGTLLVISDFSNRDFVVKKLHP